MTENELLEKTVSRGEGGPPPALPTTSRWVQAQGAVAVADLDYINSAFAHGVAKLSLARAIGVVCNQHELVGLDVSLLFAGALFRNAEAD